MSIHYQDDQVTLYQGDCLSVLAELPDNSVDSVVTDPPYGLANTSPEQFQTALAKWVHGERDYTPEGKGFMGKSWDAFVPPPAVWDECLRVLKPGGHMAVFAGARTQDLMGLSIRLAGFEIRDTLGWIYGSGFPKSMDVSKSIDKGTGENRKRQFEFTEWMRSTGITARQIDEATGTNMGGHYLTTASQPAIATADLFDLLRPLLPEVPERIERLVAERTGIGWADYVKREVIGRSSSGIGTAFGDGQWAQGKAEEFDITAPATSEAKRWSGWGTALKPAIEPIILARKPLDGTVAANVLEHGVGGLNIDACRASAGGEYVGLNVTQGGNREMAFGMNRRTFEPAPAGRFPANVLLDEHAAKEMDEQSGPAGSNSTSPGSQGVGMFGNRVGGVTHDTRDSGGASRFFPVFRYQAKAPKRERPVIERGDGTKIQHPTVKPLALMSWLVALITPEGGTTLDPFAGSGATVEAAILDGFNIIGIEREADYLELVQVRIDRTERADPTLDF